MNKGLIIFAVLCALVAFASSRPLLLFADQTDSFFSINNGWNGIAIAFATVKKGQNSHRVRVFGTNHINETLTAAWLTFQNQTIIATLSVNSNPLDRYFLGDVLMNDTYFNYLLEEKIYATVASTNHRNGSISGYFRNRPHSAVAYLDSAQVVSGSSSKGVGLAWGAINIGVIDSGSLPSDIIDQDTQIAATSFFNGRVLHNNTGTTTITFNGPANTTSTASALATANLTGVYNDGKFNNVVPNENFYAIDQGLTYYLVDGTNGSIRGQLYPVVSPTRRQIPFKAVTVSGSTRVPSAGFATLRYANQEGKDKNPNSYVSLTTASDGTNEVYEGVFYFKSATSRFNADLVRAITLELNVKISGDADWAFEVYDSFTQVFNTVGVLSLSDATEWTPAYSHYFSTATPDLANNRKELIIRISTTSSSSSSIALDLFGVRSWIPSSFTNQIWRQATKSLLTLPVKS